MASSSGIKLQGTKPYLPCFKIHFVCLDSTPSTSLQKITPSDSLCCTLAPHGTKDTNPSSGESFIKHVIAQVKKLFLKCQLPDATARFRHALAFFENWNQKSVNWNVAIGELKLNTCEMRNVKGRKLALSRSHSLRSERKQIHVIQTFVGRRVFERASNTLSWKTLFL